MIAKPNQIAKIFGEKGWFPSTKVMKAHLALCAAVVNPFAGGAHEVGESSTGGALAVPFTVGNQYPVIFGISFTIRYCLAFESSSDHKYVGKEVLFKESHRTNDSPPGGAGLPRPMAG